jgi:hypothetical protein
MQIVALDGAKLLALMLAGGVFALAGLWLMFRPQPAGEAARIELFGLKFQASSAGLLVFLIGAVFLAAPIFVPEKPAVQGNRDPITVMTERPSGTQESELVERRPPGISIETVEVEPNNTIASANLVSLGSVIEGVLTRGDVDFFAVDMPENARGDIVASVHVSNTEALLELFDDAGSPIASSRVFPGGSTSVDRPARRPRYFIGVRNRRAEEGSYALTVAIREP